MSIHEDSPQRLVSEHPRDALITINRAAQMNSLSQATRHELAATVRHLRQLAHLRTIIVTGAGGIFSVGADRNEVAQVDPVSAFEFSRRGQETLKLLTQQHSTKAISIAAIDGYCMGGGLWHWPAITAVPRRVRPSRIRARSVES